MVPVETMLKQVAPSFYKTSSYTSQAKTAFPVLTESDPDGWQFWAVMIDQVSHTVLPSEHTAPRGLTAVSKRTLFHRNCAAGCEEGIKVLPRLTLTR